ncbi:hypothetical protein JCM11641_002526 [Rhodosporidiobolus odoratus]
MTSDQPQTSAPDANSKDLSFDGQGMSASNRREEDSSYGGGERGKDFVASGGGSAYGDGQTEFGGAGRLNDDSYSRGEKGGSTGTPEYAPTAAEAAQPNNSLEGQERKMYP